MRKIIKNSLIIFGTVLFIIILYPVLLSSYGERLVIIRNLLNIIVVFDCLSIINFSIREFSYGEYKYYRLLGLKEINIFLWFIKKSGYKFMALFCLFLVSAYDGKIITALLRDIQFIAYSVCIALTLYVLMHKEQVYNIFIMVAKIISVGFVVVIIHIVLLCVNNKASFTETITSILHSRILEIYNTIILDHSIYHCIVVIIWFVILIKALHLIENKSVVEEGVFNRKRTLNLWTGLEGINRYGLIRDLIISFRDKGNLFSYILTFGIYLFCCVFFEKNVKLLMFVSFLIIVLINYGLESIYISDLLTFKYYKLLGERYIGFLKRKIAVSIMINIIFGVIYAVKCISLFYFKGFLCLVLFQAINVFYWNLYYSYQYINMKRYGTLLDDIKRLIVTIIAMIPVVNLLVGYRFYKKGKRRWNYYVNNGQSNEEV